MYNELHNQIRLGKRPRQSTGEQRVMDSDFFIKSCAFIERLLLVCMLETLLVYYVVFLDNFDVSNVCVTFLGKMVQALLCI